MPFQRPEISKFPGRACPRTPLGARAFGARPYSTPATPPSKILDPPLDRQTDRQTEFSSKILPLYKLPDRRQTDRQTNSFRDLVFDTTSPFLFPCRCEGGTDAAQVESGTQESRSSRTGQDKIIESL